MSKRSFSENPQVKETIDSSYASFTLGEEWMLRSLCTAFANTKKH